MTRSRPTLAALAIAAAGLLAGCTTASHPAPPSTPSQAPITQPAAPSSTPVSAATAPPQQPVAAPKDIDSALLAANKAVTAYNQHLFELLENPALGAGYMTNYADTKMLTGIKTTVAGYLKDGWTVTGGPTVFTPSRRLSYASQISDQHGNVWPNANAVLLGCLDNAPQKIEVAPGFPPLTKQQATYGVYPYQFDVQYFPDQKVWKVTGWNSPDSSSGLKC